jgi:hypothetical protein
LAADRSLFDPNRREFAMKKSVRKSAKKSMKRLSIVCIALCLGLCLSLSLGFSTAAYSRGGGMGSLGSHHSATTGGAFGTSPTTPGTNSAGTALSSSGGSTARTKGPPLGTGNPIVDREDKEVARMVQSICRGC